MIATRMRPVAILRVPSPVPAMKVLLMSARTHKNQADTALVGYISTISPGLQVLSTRPDLEPKAAN